MNIRLGRFFELPDKLKFLILFIFSFALRILVIFAMANLRNPQMWEFGTIANNMYTGLGYYFNIFNDSVHPMLPSAQMPPGLAYIFLLVFKIFGPFSYASNFTILLLNAVLASISVIIIYRISAIIYGEKNALLSGLMIAVFPVYIFSTVQFNSIIIYHFLLGLLFLYFLKAFYKVSNKGKEGSGIFLGKDCKIKYVIFFGIVMGIFYYFRSEFPLLMVFTVFFLFWKKLFKPAVILGVISLVVILPWTIRNYYTFDRVVLITTSLGLNLHKGHNPVLDGSGWHNGTDELPIYITDELGEKIEKVPFDRKFEINVNDISLNDAFEYIKANPEEEIIKSAKKFFYLWIYDKNHPKASNPLYLFPWLFILVFFLIGYIASLKNSGEKKLLAFLSIYLIFLTLTTIMFFSIPRYQIQASYIMIPVSMNGVMVFISFFRKKFTGKSKN